MVKKIHRPNVLKKGMRFDVPQKKDPRRSLLNGGCGGTRTHDQLIKSQLRYRLRHAPIYLIFKLDVITAPLEKPARICLRKRDTVFLDSTSFVTLTRLALPLGASPLPYLSQNLTFSQLLLGRVPRTHIFNFQQYNISTKFLLQQNLLFLFFHT